MEAHSIERTGDSLWVSVTDDNGERKSVLFLISEGKPAIADSGTPAYRLAVKLARYWFNEYASVLATGGA